MNVELSTKECKEGKVADKSALLRSQYFNCGNRFSYTLKSACETYCINEGAAMLVLFFLRRGFICTFRQTETQNELLCSYLKVVYNILKKLSDDIAISEMVFTIILYVLSAA